MKHLHLVFLAVILAAFSIPAGAARADEVKPALRGWVSHSISGQYHLAWIKRYDGKQLWVMSDTGFQGWVPREFADARVAVTLGYASAEMKAVVAAQDAEARAKAAEEARIRMAGELAGQKFRAEQAAKAAAEREERAVKAMEQMAEEMRYRNWQEQDRLERRRLLLGY